MSEMSRYIFRIQNPGKVKKPNTKSVHTCDSTVFSFSLVYLFAQISRPPDFDFFIVPVASRFSELHAWTKTQPSCVLNFIVNDSRSSLTDVHCT